MIQPNIRHSRCCWRRYRIYCTHEGGPFSSIHRSTEIHPVAGDTISFYVHIRGPSLSDVQNRHPVAFNSVTFSVHILGTSLSVVKNTVDILLLTIMPHLVYTSGGSSLAGLQVLLLMTLPHLVFTSGALSFSKLNNKNNFYFTDLVKESQTTID